MIHRPRRLRSSPLLREAVAETRFSSHQLILPLFLTDGTGVKTPITSLENHYQCSVDQICAYVAPLLTLGVTKFLLFGVPHEKDPQGSQGYHPQGVVNRALRTLKQQFGRDIFLIADVCLCEYTSHGHCGHLCGEGDSATVDNDLTLEILAKVALSNAQAGADMIAPSDMMDGRVGHLRLALDQGGFSHLPILSYAVKYASSFYGPFREAAQSAPAFGDRKTYQMDCRNRREALREIALDQGEGADILMVKPALSYLDVIREVRNETTLPICAYSVSGEYAMIKAVSKTGVMDEFALMRETTLSIFRAGTDLLISYYTPELVEALQRGEM